MGEIRIVGPGKTRGYPYLVCKKKFYNTLFRNFLHKTLRKANTYQKMNTFMLRLILYDSLYIFTLYRTIMCGGIGDA